MRDPGFETSCLNLTALFGNDRPVEVDLGCGKGTFLAKEAARRPDTNFVGVDWLTRKINRAVREVRERKLRNVRFIRTDAREFVSRYLPRTSITVFHIYFPDPWPKERHRKHRFVNPGLIAQLAKALVPGGSVWFSTDFRDYHDDVIRFFRSFSLFRRTEYPLPPVESITDFERDFMALGLPVYRAGFVKQADSGYPSTSMGG